MPALLQASINNVPAGAVTFLPPTVMFTSGMKSFLFTDCRSYGLKNSSIRKSDNSSIRHRHLSDALLFKRARLTFEMIFKLFTEFLHN